MTDTDRERAIQVNIRLSPAEYKLLTKLEEWTGDNRSALIRRWIRAEHKRETRER